MRLATVVAALALAGCAATAPYRTIELAFDGQAQAIDPRAPPDELAIAQVAARLIHDRLGLPFPAATTLHLYASQASFAEGLSREAGMDGDAAWSRSRFASGFSSPHGIFLRADRLASMSAVDRVGTIAHELTHIAQGEMRRGGRGAAAQWIHEGHADWVKFRVIEMLGLRTYAASRAEVWRSALRSPTPIQRFPSLVDLSRADQWTEARGRLGSAATYGQAFLAVDALVEGYGIERLHEFLRRFSLDAPPASHWRAVFPVPFARFVQHFRARLEAWPESRLESPR
ncbi:MAG: hypothetical protein HY294_17040 [Candidatus Rokubacteria bacterium]|nr:hypothetical protein [Candidatus Rokubacteria bacterium]